VKGIRFTKSERDSLKKILGHVHLSDYGSRIVKDAHAILEKLELAEMPVKKGTYLSTNDAIAAFKEVLGQRLLAPGFQAVGVLAQMKNRIQALGLTRQDCVTIAKVAGSEWQGVIRAESLVRQADKLLAKSQLDIKSFAPPPRGGGAVELSDDEI
jgi:hypothetical protein